MKDNFSTELIDGDSILKITKLVINIIFLLLYKQKWKINFSSRT